MNVYRIEYFRLKNDICHLVANYDFVDLHTCMYILTFSMFLCCILGTC